MRRTILLGAGALLAGMIFGVATIAWSPSPTPAALIQLSPTAVAAGPLAVNSAAFLVAEVPTVGPTKTTVPSPTVPATETPVPPTATQVPVTPTAVVVAPTRTGNDQAPEVDAWSVVVVDEQSGAVLYSRDAHRRLAPASLTKIFTALVALTRGGDIHANIPIQFDSTELVDSTLMGIKTGETYTLEDLLYGLMLPSGNDAALAIANAIAGSESGFAAMMNSQASDLGLTDSHFVNAHGLDAANHYSSAYDLTMAARYAMIHQPEFRLLAKAHSWDVHGSRGYTILNLNRFLSNYSGADGVKIGYTDNAGRGIVASATRNGHRVYVGLLHTGDIVADSTPLFNWVFANYTWPTT